MNASLRMFAAYAGIACLLVGTVFFVVHDAFARNIVSYKDTLSDSRPEAYSNHNLAFTINSNVAPGGYAEFTPGPGFTIEAASSTWSERNVELVVNGVPRAASSTGDSVTDLVEIIPGNPGMIRYTLNPTTGISSGSQLEFKIGTDTSQSFLGDTVISTTTGSSSEEITITTVLPEDVTGVQNPAATGTHRLNLRFYGADDPTYADFVVAVVDPVTIPNLDTRSTDPTEIFDGQPEGGLSGTTNIVEMSVRTGSRSTCLYSLDPDVEYEDKTGTFSFSNSVYHSVLFPVTPDTTYTIHVRCIDDELNINPDDYIFSFTVPVVPIGDPNEEGENEGDGSGTGDTDTGGGNSGGSGTSDGSGSGPDDTGATDSSGGSGGGGGGGGGGGSGGGSGGGFRNDGPYESGDAQVLVTGYAYPNSTVTVSVDGQPVETARASATGLYEATIEQIARGAYTFGVFATDSSGTKSSTYSTSFTVSGARTSSLSNVNVPPSIKVTPDPVDPGATLTVSGYALPNAVVTIENGPVGSSAGKQTFTANTDAQGAWSLTIPTNGFSQGTYQVRAKAEQTGDITRKTNFSAYTLYGVGQAADRPLSADLNRDGKVNLIDFSILLFWWNTDGGTSDPPADINQDNRVNLTDFSILLFNWTG